MKNLINTAVNSTTNRRQGKFTIANEVTTQQQHKKTTRSISYSHSDSFINDLSLSLKDCELDINDNRTENSSSSTSHFVHDCNTNVVSHQKHTNLRRLKSWNKGITKRLRNFEEHLPTSDEILESLRQQVRYKHKRTKSDISYQWQGIGYSVDDKWKGFGYTVPSTQIESPSTATRRRQKIISDLRKISKEHIQTPLRKLSSVSRKISDTSLDSPESSSSVEFIDFGACYSPEEMKTWGQVLEKLATTIRHTNNTAHRRYSNFSGTLNTTLRGSAKRLSGHKNRKSYDCNIHKTNEHDEGDGEENGIEFGNNFSSNSLLDLSLSRENLDEDLTTSSGISFSSNVWYYGELDIIDNSNNHAEEEEEESSHFEKGNIVVRVDCHGDVIYSLTYDLNGEVSVGTFPLDNGRYCLNFSDPHQPRFSSVKFLLAYLIEQKFLQRVSFSWLIENSVML